MTAIEQTIDVDGVGVAITDEGARDARPIVMLHGGSRTLADWLFVGPKLAEDYRVVSVDFRGHGKSDAVATYDWADGVADCAGVVEALDLRDPVIVGHSLGGMTAIRYAAEGNRCAAVVNVDGFGTGHPSEFPGYTEDEARTKLEGFAALSEKEFLDPQDTGDDAWLDAAVSQYRKGIEAMSLPWETAEPLVRRGYRQLPDGRWQTSPAGSINASMYRSLFLTDHWAYYDKVSVPTLVIRSTKDDHGMEDPDTLAFLDSMRLGLDQLLDAQKARRSDFHVEHFDTAHMVMWEKPVELIESIRRFVASL
jgi:pimeloyl-ACP methyl ester carboxylesterase